MWRSQMRTMKRIEEIQRIRVKRSVIRIMSAWKKVTLPRNVLLTKRK